MRTYRPSGFPSSASACPSIPNTWVADPQPYVRQGPTVAFSQLVDSLCTNVKARLPVIDAARRLTTAPLGSLPANIYDATGDWQSLSTPGRDTTLRGSVKDIFELVQGSLAGSDAHTVAGRFLSTWRARESACTFAYTRSNGAIQTLPLGELIKRIYKTSFDPYHCPELRWGADAGAGAEFATCNTQDAAHMARYNDEQTLRNYLERPAAGSTPLGSGPAQGEDIDFVALIERVAQ
jgi:hypothetical protein